MENTKKQEVFAAFIVIAILLLCIFEQILKRRKSTNGLEVVDLHTKHLSTSSDENALNKLTLVDIRKTPGYEFVSDEEGHKIIDGLYQLSLITLAIYENEFKQF